MVERSCQLILIVHIKSDAAHIVVYYHVYFVPSVILLSFLQKIKLRIDLHKSVVPESEENRCLLSADLAVLLLALLEQSDIAGLQFFIVGAALERKMLRR